MNAKYIPFRIALPSTPARPIVWPLAEVDELELGSFFLRGPEMGSSPKLGLGLFPRCDWDMEGVAVRLIGFLEVVGRDKGAAFNVIIWLMPTRVELS